MQPPAGSKPAGGFLPVGCLALVNLNFHTSLMGKTRIPPGAAGHLHLTFSQYIKEGSFLFTILQVAMSHVDSENHLLLEQDQSLPPQ